MIRLDVQGQLDVKRKLKLLQLPPARRRRFLGQIARKIRSQSRKRLREQKNIGGAPWEPKKARGRKKMLKGFSKHMIAKATTNAATVTVAGKGAVIANQHQKGYSEFISYQGSKLQELNGRKYQSNAQATFRQAEALIDEGFKARKSSGKGYRTPTKRWIKNNLSMAQAGAIYRSMSDTTPKSKWEIPLPSRSFLGATENEINSMVNTVFDQTIRAGA